MSKGELKRRFFIAVYPPEHIAKALHEATKDIDEDWDRKIPEDYHISLAFPGHLTMAQVERLEESLAELEHAPFKISLTGVSFHWRDPFDKNARNHVLWARADNDGDNELSDLHSKLVTLLQQKNFRHGLRDISPHITIARPPPEAGDLMKEFAKAHAHIEGESWVCDRIYICETLEKSDPRHPANNNGDGSKFVKVAEIKLKR